MALTRPECRPGRAYSVTRRCGKWSTSSVTYPPRAAWGFQRSTKKKRKNTNICTRRKTTTSLPALGNSPRRLLLCKRSDVIHYIPNLLRLHPSFFSCHLPLAIHDDPVDLSIRQFLQRRCLAVVFQLQVHALRQVAVTCPFFSVTHRAIKAVSLLPLRNRLWRSLHRIHWLAGSPSGLLPTCFFFSGFLLLLPNGQPQHSP